MALWARLWTVGFHKRRRTAPPSQVPCTLPLYRLHTWTLVSSGLSLYCDGFAQSIKLWSQETPLLGKHVQAYTRLTIRQKRCFLCGPLRDSLLGNWVVTRLYNSRVSGVFYAVRSVQRNYKTVKFRGCSSTEEYKKSVVEQEWEFSQLSVDGHGKLVVGEELEVSLWGLSMWLECLVTVRLIIPLPGYD
jgi:hypothetical protein